MLTGSGPSVCMTTPLCKWQDNKRRQNKQNLKRRQYKQGKGDKTNKRRKNKQGKGDTTNKEKETKQTKGDKTNNEKETKQTNLFVMVPSPCLFCLILCVLYPFPCLCCHTWGPHPADERGCEALSSPENTRNPPEIIKNQ